MLSTIWIVLLGLACLVALFVVIVALQPSDFQVIRTASVSAPPETVFAQVNDFHNWDGWSPWAKLDPSVVNTYDGPSSGIGAGFRWSGNNQAGEGHMTITESHPSELIRIKLDFLRPFVASHRVEFTFKPEGGQTVVSWSMSGQKNFVIKAFGVFTSMDKMLGTEFEKGLANLKARSEAAATA